MSIEILKEVTDWQDLKINNGFYHVNTAGHLIAHQPAGGKLKVFKNPLKNFSKTRRKFVKVGDYLEKNNLGGIPVPGSNGNTYYIVDGKCNCKGFQFRGDCKHVRSIS